MSGNLPISSAEMESTTPPASLFASMARPSEPLIPRTSIISGSCAAVSATAGSVAIVLSTASTALDTPFFLYLAMLSVLSKLGSIKIDICPSSLTCGCNPVPSSKICNAFIIEYSPAIVFVCNC